MSSRFHPPAKLTVAEILEATKGRLLGGETEGGGFCTDSRAMRREPFPSTFDGHRFVEQVTVVGGRSGRGASVRPARDRSFSSPTPWSHSDGLRVPCCSGAILLLPRHGLTARRPPER